MISPNYQQSTFLMSAPSLKHCPPDDGFEVAFMGRSNAGKSSALNCLLNKKIARTSKTPGRTQSINLFNVDEQRRLVDLPGYGYAKVSKSTRNDWQKNLSEYLQKRQCLKGIILLTDCRLPLKDSDINVLQWSHSIQLPIHILLTKADKLQRSAMQIQWMKVKKQLCEHQLNLHCTSQLFSATKKYGFEELIQVINKWFQVS